MDPAPESLGQLLLQAFWWLDQRASAEFAAGREEAVSAAQALMLRRIPPDGARPVHLARALGVSRQAVQQTLDDLQEAGLIERGRSVGGRGVLVTLTLDGRRRAEAVVVADRAAQEAISERIGADQVDALRGALAADWGEP